MKKVYFKPEIMVVAVNQQQALLTTPSSGSAGPSSDFMSNPTISINETVKRDRYNVWDDDWSQ